MLLLVLLVTLGFTLIGTQVFLSGATNRTFNVPLVAATVLLVRDAALVRRLAGEHGGHISVPAPALVTLEAASAHVVTPEVLNRAAVC